MVSRVYVDNREIIIYVLGSSATPSCNALRVSIIVKTQVGQVFHSYDHTLEIVRRIVIEMIHHLSSPKKGL